MCFWVVLIHSISRVWCPKDLFSVPVCKGFTMELLRPCSGQVMVRGSQGRDDIIMADLLIYFLFFMDDIKENELQ